MSENNKPNERWDPSNWFLPVFSLLIFVASFSLIAWLVWWHLEVWAQRSAEVELDADALPVEIFHVVLPIVAGWIGVVLGYYFSNRSADAGARQVLEAQRANAPLAQKLTEYRVIDEMIALADITKIVLETDSDGKITNKFSELKAIVERPGFTRTPMFTARNGDVVFKAIAHESIIYKFDSRMRSVGQNPDDMSIQNFLDDDEVIETIEGTTAFVSRRATLQDAKVAMEARKGCQDVFVTKTGRETDPVEGWLPNVWILRRTIARAES
ncbi:MAG: hypothetical protein AAFQ22_15390 [Pseudomonadota bacterium]